MDPQNAATSLVEVPGAELHVVEDGQQRMMMKDCVFSIGVEPSIDNCTAVVASCTPPAGAHGSASAATTSTTWPLRKDLPVLQASPEVYSFALADSRTRYYVVVLPSNAPTDALAAVADVVAASSAASSPALVDAAAEEADRQKGGKAAKGAAAEADAALLASSTAVQATEPPPAATATAAAPQQQRPPALPPSGNKTADTIANGLISGGSMLGGLIVRAATAAADAAHAAAHRQIRSTQPAQQQARVSPHLQRGLKVAAVAAQGASKATGALAGAMGNAAFAVASALGPKQQQPQKQQAAASSASDAAALPTLRPSSATPAAGDVQPEQRSALKTIGAGGLLAYVQVYDALEHAALLALVGSGDAAAHYCRHRWGDEAAEAAASSVPVAGDMLRAGLNLTRLGARAFVSKAAKRTMQLYVADAVPADALGGEGGGSGRAP